jgi:hypothetical protein
LRWIVRRRRPPKPRNPIPKRPFFSGSGGVKDTAFATGDGAGVGEAVAATDDPPLRAAPHSGHFVRHPRESRSGVDGEFIFYLCHAKSCDAAGVLGLSVAESHSAVISCGCSY